MKQSARGHNPAGRVLWAVASFIGVVGIGCSSANIQADEGQAFCEAVAALDLSAQAYRDLAEVTPPARRDDVERFARFLADLEALEGADASEHREAITTNPAYQETLQRIGNYVTEECGIGGDATPTSQPEAQPPGTDDSAGAPGVPAPGPETFGAEDPDGDDDADGTASRREEAAVPPDEVKAEMREIFGGRLWGTSHGYFAPDGSEYEGNVNELTEDEALSACQQLSAFIAEHAAMEGQGMLRLTDITVNADNEMVTNPIALNETIAVGDPGRCHPA